MPREPRQVGPGLPGLRQVLADLEENFLDDPKARELVGDVRVRIATEIESTEQELNRAKQKEAQLSKARADLKAAREEVRQLKARQEELEASASRGDRPEAYAELFNATSQRLEQSFEVLEGAIKRLQADHQALIPRLTELTGNASKVSGLERRITDLQKQIEARDKIIEDLQGPRPKGRSEETRGPAKEPLDLIQALHADLTSMARSTQDEAFSLGNVEFDLVAPLDMEGERAVMRFTPEALNAPGGVSHIRFRLIRNINIRSTDEEAD